MKCKNCPYLESFSWCDKVGGKVYYFGCCEDAYFDIPKHENHSKKKRRNKRERDLKYKNHLKCLVESDSNKHPSSAIYTDEVFITGQGYVKNPKPYYKRIYRRQYSKYLKKQSNKKIRRYKGKLHNGRLCYRLYDFWWEYS